MPLHPFCYLPCQLRHQDKMVCQLNTCFVVQGNFRSTYYFNFCSPNPFLISRLSIGYSWHDDFLLHAQENRLT